MDKVVKYLICFFVGFLLARMVGNGFSVGGGEHKNEGNQNTLYITKSLGMDGGDELVFSAKNGEIIKVIGEPGAVVTLSYWDPNDNKSKTDVCDSKGAADPSGGHVMGCEFDFSTTPPCEQILFSLCGKTKNIEDCDACAGAEHQEAVREAGCSGTAIQQWCKSQHYPCSRILLSLCGKTKNIQDCESCAEHQKAVEDAGCSGTAIKQWCKSQHYTNK